MDYLDFFKNQLSQLKVQGRYRIFANLERIVGKAPYALWHSPTGPRQVTVWCSNDYLGMSHHPQVIDALQQAVAQYGAGAGGTRNIAGTARSHIQLENTLATWHGKESALLFSSGYVANEASLYALGTNIPDCVFFSDEKNHASIIHGIKSSRAHRHIFKHNNMADLEALLRQYPPQTPKIIVAVSVYSMDGDMAPLADIITLAKRYNALTFVDEVHAVGLYGPTGAGLAEQLGLSEDIDIIQANFAKAIGVVGGYIAGQAAVVDYVRSFAPGFIFTTSLPPATAAAAHASITHIQHDSTLRQNLHTNVNELRAQLRAEGIPFMDAPSHITPVVMGDAIHCRNVTDVLLNTYGHYVQPINYPTVPLGQERLRITVTPAHSTQDIRGFAQALRAALIATSQAAA
jgi:5-aminolevulinate synthase